MDQYNRDELSTGENNSNSGEGVVRFKGNLVPSPRLVGNEKELMSMRAGLMEVGLLGFVLRRKEQIVLTSERVFQYSSRIGASYLRMMPLKQVESVTIGGQLNFIMIGMALASVLAGIFADVEVYIKIFLLLFGAALAFFSRSKVIIVSSGNRKDAIILPLSRIDIKESKKFLDMMSENLKK